MKCEECKYHSYIGGTHFCDSRNHKRKTVRISEEDAQKDIDCKWADNGGDDNAMIMQSEKPKTLPIQYTVTNEKGEVVLSISGRYEVKESDKEKLDDEKGLN